MPMKAFIATGNLRHRVAIVQPTNSQDGFGGVNLTDNTVVLTTWASIETFTGYHEGLHVSAIFSTVTHKITIRNPRNVPILAKQQVQFRGVGGRARQFQIAAVMNPDERNKMLVLMCVELNDSAQQAVNPATDLK